VIGTIDDPAADESTETRMVAPRALREDPQRLLDVEVRADAGARVALREVATRLVPASILRTDRERQITLLMSLVPGVSEQGVIEALRAAEARLGMGSDERGAPAGNARELERTAVGFGIAIVLSLVFMYSVLAAQFESFVDPAIVLVSLPLTVPFALLSLLLAGQTLNVFSALGVLVLFGVVKKNAILQVDHVRGLRAGGMPRGLAVLHGNRVRLRPILMTTLAFVIGAVPLVRSTGSGAGSYSAIGWVVIGGQSLALLLTLVATPVLSTLVEDGVARLRAKRTELHHAFRPVA
jgi:HAE1 family hydrophobic/amphiphilic exporter-1